jgi:glucokinase
MRTAVGVDIGGTKIVAGVISDSGRVLQRAETRTPGGGPQAVIAAVIRTVRTLRSTGAAGIGVGVPGILHPGSGVVAAATGLLQDWASTDVPAALREAFTLPVVAVNDAHGHAVGEAAHGAGVGRDTVLVVAVGTGIGGAVVYRGAALLGAHGAAGHVGHLPSAVAAGCPCSCGRSGHIEGIASGPGLVALYGSHGGEPSVLDPKEVLARAVVDPLAAAAVRESASALGTVVGGLVNTVDPDVVIISGGLQHAGPIWWTPLREGVAATALPLLESVPVLPARLGRDAALVGTATIALDVAV